MVTDRSREDVVSSVRSICDFLLNPHHPFYGRGYEKGIKRRRVVTVSVETQKLLAQLPPMFASHECRTLNPSERGLRVLP